MRSTGAAGHAGSVFHVHLRRPVNAGVRLQRQPHEIPMSSPADWSVEKLETVARSYEHDAIDAEPTTHPGAPFWKKLGMAASARGCILEKEPSNEQALLRLYDFVQMHTFDPPALSRAMSGVLSHWSGRIQRKPNDVVSLLRMAIATNIAEGINGYPGSKWLKRAVSIKKDHPEVCIEMGIFLRHSYNVCKPWTWLNRRNAHRWLQTALQNAHTSARANAQLALATADKSEHARLMLECHRLDPDHVFGALYAKVVSEA